MPANIYTPRSEIGSAINYIANADAKALGFTALVVEGENTGSSLAHTVAEHTGVIACISLISAYPITYMKGGFAESRRGIGANGRDATFYKAENQEIALPVIGTSLEWADMYDTPLFELYSGTPSKGQGHAPLNTVQIIDGLLQGLSIAKMELPGYKKSPRGWVTAFNSRLASMVESGLVETYDDPNEFTILDPTYRGRIPFSRLRPTTQLTYQLLQLAKAAHPEANWNVEGLLAFAKTHNIAPEVGRSALSASLVTAASVNQPRDFPGAVKKINIKPREYRIARGFEEAADDLVRRLYKINEGKKNNTKPATDYAREAYLDPIMAARILERGIANSPYVDK